MAQFCSQVKQGQIFSSEIRILNILGPITIFRHQFFGGFLPKSNTIFFTGKDAL